MQIRPLKNSKEIGYFEDYCDYSNYSEQPPKYSAIMNLKKYWHLRFTHLITINKDKLNFQFQIRAKRAMKVIKAHHLI